MLIISKNGKIKPKDILRQIIGGTNKNANEDASEDDSEKNTDYLSEQPQDVLKDNKSSDDNPARQLIKQGLQGLFKK